MVGMFELGFCTDHEKSLNLCFQLNYDHTTIVEVASSNFRMVCKPSRQWNRARA